MEHTSQHYDFDYKLSEADIKAGFIRLDPYFVSKQWKLGSKDESCIIFHSLKTIARFGMKNNAEREIKALYVQAKALARLYGVTLDV